MPGVLVKCSSERSNILTMVGVPAGITVYAVPTEPAKGSNNEASTVFDCVSKLISQRWYLFSVIGIVVPAPPVPVFPALYHALSSVVPGWM